MKKFFKVVLAFFLTGIWATITCGGTMFLLGGSTHEGDSVIIYGSISLLISIIVGVIILHLGLKYANKEDRVEKNVQWDDEIKIDKI